MCCAWVAIAGIPPFSGFFSKDAILAAAYEHSPAIYWVGVITAALTAFYVSRAMFLTFFGEPRGQHHPHESPPGDVDPAGHPRGFSPWPGAISSMYPST